MSNRRRPPFRRPSTTFDVVAFNLKFTVTATAFAGGGLAELFIKNHKCDSAAGIMASDAAIAASLAPAIWVPVRCTAKRSMPRQPWPRIVSYWGCARQACGRAMSELRPHMIFRTRAKRYLRRRGLLLEDLGVSNIELIARLKPAFPEMPEGRANQYQYLAEKIGHQESLTSEEIKKFGSISFGHPHYRGPTPKFVIRELLARIGFNGPAILSQAATSLLWKQCDAKARAEIEQFIRRPNVVPPPLPLRSSHAGRQAFYQGDEWLEVRYRALKLHGGRCQCCGRRPLECGPLHVDHIKPRSKYPALELDINNLQVLCQDCNFGKSNRDETDWRAA